MYRERCIGQQDAFDRARRIVVEIVWQKLFPLLKGPPASLSTVTVRPLGERSDRIRSPAHE